MKIRVNPHTVEIVKEQTEPINEKEIKVSKCEFEFDEAITSDFVKEAYFTLNGNTYKMIVENNECDYPSEVLTEKGTLEIGVVAFKVENDEEIVRYNPSPDYFESWVGSLKDAENSEPITPSEMEQFEQELQKGLNEIDDKIDEVDDKIEEVNTAITETNNLNLDVSDKVDGDVTVTLTKKDASTKSVVISDGTSLQFMWQGTSLGIKTDDMSEYVFVDLQGVQGVPGPKGDAFQIKKTYPTVEAMNADFNNMELGDYVMIASEVSIEDNAKLYTRGQNAWIFISDFSGAQGIKGETGATPNIQIGTVTSGSTPSVTRTGTDENPVLNFVLQPGEKGNTGDKGDTGNGIDHISLTSQSGATKVYTIYFTDGNTTTFTVEDGEVTQEVFDEEVDRLKMVYNAMPKTSGEGTDLTLNNTAECPVYDIELSPSELSQEADPTPDNPQEIHTVSGENTITISNSDNTQSQTYPISLGNLEYCKIGDYEDEFIKNSGKNLVSSKISSYAIGSNGRFASNSDYDMHIAQVIQGETYTATTNDSQFVAGFFTELPTINSTSYNSSRIVQNEKTFTAPITGYVAFRSLARYTTPMLNSGTTALPYEPYGSNEWYLKKNIGKEIYDGTETWAKSSSLANSYYSNLPNSKSIGENDTTIYVFCNNFIRTYKNNLTNLDYACALSVRNNIMIKNKDISTVGDFKDFLTTHNAIVYYVLETPTYTLLNDTLQTQLDNLAKAISYQEQTNVSQTNADLPFIIKMSAIRDLSGIFEEI